MPRKAKEKDIQLNTKQTEAKKEKKASTKSNTKVSKNTSTLVKTSTQKKSSKTQKTAVVKKTKESSLKNKKVQPIAEYYDLPFRYNQTIVKILAQTPNILFIYWDISDDDRKKYEKEYGENFFEQTIPYLIITNRTKNYTFEVRINDFANSWYLHVNDADCDYQVELGRKFVDNSAQNSKTYLPIISSNDIEMPNNHILFDNLGKSIFFRNTKTNIVTPKDISSISFMQNIGKVYNIYDLYKEIYKDELTGDEFKLNFPSSNSSSKTFEEEM